MTIKEHTESDVNDYLNTLKEKLLEDPLNCFLHLQLAIDSGNKNNHYLAYAELKTSEYLGLDKTNILKYKNDFLSKIPDLLQLNHNQYFRFKSLSNEIVKRIADYQKESISILDVGGGNGILASFIPECQYCLAEPSINGINGINLPFDDNSFDFVVACHVLEHIPVNNRDTFLDQLLSKCKRGVILLNPVYVSQTLPEERMKLFIEITNASWAKEHIECSLPSVKSIEKYAEKRNLQLYYSPNGTLTTSMAFVFIDFFASKFNNKEDYFKINRFFNSKYFDLLNSNDFPNAVLFYLKKE